MKHNLGTITGMSLLILLAACSSNTGNGGYTAPTPTGGTTVPGNTVPSSTLPTVNVPKLGTLKQLVPAFEQTTKTFTQDHVAVVNSYESMVNLPPDAPAADYQAQVANFSAASLAWQKSALTLNGYGAQFPAFHKENDGAKPTVPFDAVAAMNANTAGLSSALAQLDAQLKAGNITAAQYASQRASLFKNLPIKIVKTTLTTKDGLPAATLTTMAVGVAASHGLIGTASVAVGGVLLELSPVGIALTAGVVVKLVWSACTSVGKADGDYCTMTSVDLTANTVLPVPPGATLMIDIPGKPPIFIDNLNIKPGEVVKIGGEVGDPNTETPNGPPVIQQVDPGDFASCAGVFAVTAAASPPDPGPGQGVTVTATTQPPVAGCAMKFAIVGTDKYTKTDTVTTDASGMGTFFIPGGAQGVVDTVTIEVGGHKSAITYTF